MIRAQDDEGRDVLGLTRPEIDGLLAGKVCCFQQDLPRPGMLHICIYFGETNADVLQRIRAAYAGNGAMQPALDAPVDLRTRPEREDN